MPEVDKDGLPAAVVSELEQTTFAEPVPGNETEVSVTLDRDPGVVIDMEPVADGTVVTVSEASPDVVFDSVPVDAETPGGTPINAEPDAGRSRPAKAWRRDQVLLEDEATARQAAEETANKGAVGEHLGSVMVGERLALHRFAALDAGYPGWVWEVALARAPRSKTVTVSEVGMYPGASALLAPPWVPWSERLEPGDVSRQDVLAYEANDPRLQAGFEQTAEEGADLRTIDEIGYGRVRVLSQEGTDQAAERWYNGPNGPVPGTKPKAMCGNCGFLVKIAGSLGTMFGACANGWSPDDGTVVSLDHTCGAHSETDQPKHRPQWPVVPSRINDSAIEDATEVLVEQMADEPADLA